MSLQICKTFACLLTANALLAAADAKAGEPRHTGKLGTTQKEWTWRSSHLRAEIVVKPGVFTPMEAEQRVLPFLWENAGLFEGKEVMEIGTGSGIISLYAAALGAKRVVSTDILPNAIASVKENAEKLGFADVIEPRIVSLDDISAFSTIGPTETFDVLVSNPPYSLDLEAPENTAVVDRGDLGFSIVRGLRQHLKPGGVAILLYESLFYHHVMVMFARNSGFVVRNHGPDTFTSWEAEAVFNSYLERLLVREGLDPHAFRFDRRRKGGALKKIRAESKTRPLFRGNTRIPYPGMIVIERGP